MFNWLTKNTNIINKMIDLKDENIYLQQITYLPQASKPEY